MTAEIEVFQRPEFGQLRVMLRDGEEWFFASEVAAALGYARPADAVKQHCKKVNKITEYCDSPNSAPVNYNTIPVSDVFRLIMRSNLPSAESFQDWVMEEILPSIRKTGQYSLVKAPVADYMAAGRLVLEAAGITGNQLALAMDKYLVAYGGRSMLTAANVELVAPMQGQLLTPTELGKEFDPVLSAKAINLLLAAAGMQRRLENGSWEPTEEGKVMGAVLLDTGKKHKHNGTPVRQLKWTRTPELLNRLREQIAAQVQEAV